MANQRKKQQVSNAVAIYRLQKAFNSLLHTLTSKDKEVLDYFAAVNDALSKAFPDKFSNHPDQNIYIKFLCKRYPEVAAQLQAQKDKDEKYTVSETLPANTDGVVVDVYGNN